jgi:hypothetical protein
MSAFRQSGKAVYLLEMTARFTNAPFGELTVGDPFATLTFDDRVGTPAGA